MKKIFTLAAALMASFSLWAQSDADIAIDAMTESTVETYFKSYGDATLVYAGTYQQTGSNYNIKCDQTNNSAYVGVTATKELSKVAFLVTGNGNNKNINAGLIGYQNVAETPNFAITDYASFVSPSVAIPSANYSDAQWVEFDLSGLELKAVYFAKQWKNVVAGSAASASYPSGNAQSLFVYGIRVWFAGESVTYSVTYKANNGTEAADVVAENAKKVASNMFDAPEGMRFAGWNTAADGNGDAYAAGDALSSDLTLYAQWEAITSCANIIPAASGTAPTEVGTEIDLNIDSEGGKIIVAGMKTPGESIVYNALGLGLMKGGADSVRIEFNNLIAEGSVIKLVIVANGTGSRGLKLQTVTKSTLLDASWSAEAAGELKEFEYTVPAGSPLIGDYRILLARNNSVFLQSVSMSACGEARDIPVDTDPVLKASKASVDMALTAANPTPSATVTFTGKNLAAGTYNLTIPEVAGLTVNPTSVTVGEDGKLSAEVTIAYTSAVDVAAASANIVLTIGELNATVAVNYSAVLAKNYINASVNIEGLVMENGTGYNIAAAFNAANIEYASLNDLDTLNDGKGAARNEAYLGLKLKTTGAYIAGWVEAGKTIRVKFGNLPAAIKVTLNGVAAADHTAGVYEFTAEADTYVKLATSASSTVVIKQIMIDEPIANVMYPITYSIGEGGTVSGWTVAFPGEEVVMDITSNEGFALNSLTYNGTAMVQPGPGQPISFVMPAEAVEVAASFGDITTAIDNNEAEVKAVKRIVNGQLLIEKNGIRYNAQGAIVK